MKCHDENDMREATLFGQDNEDNSLLYWFPKIQKLGIPYPKTVMQKITKNTWELAPFIDGDHTPLKDDLSGLHKAAREIGYPLFMRTDECSNKHDWAKTCYVHSDQYLENNIANLIEFSYIADMFGLPIRAFVFRKFIEMKTIFLAFDGMPVNPEYRFFIKNGKVICHHWYWIKEAIRKGPNKVNLLHNWEELLDQSRKDSEKYLPLLKDYAQRVADEFDGFWSVDFCQGADNWWYLIDMAKGSVSYHPKNEDE